MKLLSLHLIIMSMFIYNVTINANQGCQIVFYSAVGSLVCTSITAGSSLLCQWILGGIMEKTKQIDLTHLEDGNSHAQPLITIPAYSKIKKYAQYQNISCYLTSISIAGFMILGGVVVGTASCY